MKLAAAVANALWWASSLPAWFAFRHALAKPAQAQAKVLRQILRQAADTSFGREHGFDSIRSAEYFRSRVPLRTYDDFAPYIDRIRSGETNVLTADRVIRLATTSGTTRDRKLIPFTRSLQAQMNRAIAPWIVDLFHTYPDLIAGPAYWSISPVEPEHSPEHSAVPIGFEDDGEYLGAWRRHLINAVLAVPNQVRHAPDMTEWRSLTRKYLRQSPELRFISIWHPSFLTLLTADPDGIPRSAWPRLRVISCWADGQADLAAEAFRAQFPGVVIQPKGLIATEGVVSIPFAGKWPLAIRSHYYEFIDAGDIRQSHELVDGRTYEVVLTTAGGLYRYRLGDLIRVEGFVAKTPSIRFLGRTGNVSDRFGEKLAEAFVAGVVNQLRIRHGPDWRFAMLAPDGSRYALFIEGKLCGSLAQELDAGLRRNPHYAYCRDLGQLGRPVIHGVRDADAAFIRRMTSSGQHIGDIKPTVLSRLDGWSHFFKFC